MAQCRTVNFEKLRNVPVEVFAIVISIVIIISCFVRHLARH